MPVYEPDLPEYTLFRESIPFKHSALVRKNRSLAEVDIGPPDHYQEISDIAYFMRSRGTDSGVDTKVIFQWENRIKGIVFIPEAETTIGPLVFTNGTFAKHLGGFFPGMTGCYQKRPQNGEASSAAKGQAANPKGAKNQTPLRSSLFVNDRRTGSTGAGNSGGDGRPPVRPLGLGDFFEKDQPEIDILVIILKHLLGYIFSYAEGDMDDFIHRLIRVIEYLQSAISAGDLPHYQSQSVNVCVQHLLSFETDVRGTLQALSRSWLSGLTGNNLLVLRNLVVSLVSQLLLRTDGRQRLWVSVPLLRANAPTYNFPRIEAALKIEQDGNMKNIALISEVQRRHPAISRSGSTSSRYSSVTIADSISGIDDDFPQLLELLRKLVPKKTQPERWSDEAHGLFGLLALGFSSTTELMSFAAMLGVFEAGSQVGDNGTALSLAAARRMLIQLFVLHLSKSGTRKEFIKTYQNFLGVQFSSIMDRLRAERDNLKDFAQSEEMDDGGNESDTTIVEEEGIETLLVAFINAHASDNAALIPIADSGVRAMAASLTVEDLKKAGADIEI